MAKKRSVSSCASIKSKKLNKKLLVFLIVLAIVALAVFLYAAQSRNIEEADIHLQQGKLFFENNETVHAIEELEKAVKLDPKNDEAYNHLALAHYANNEFYKSVKSYKNSIGINPNNAETHRRLGFSYYRINEFKN